MPDENLRPISAAGVREALRGLDMPNTMGVLAAPWASRAWSRVRRSESIRSHQADDFILQHLPKKKQEHKKSV
jgi:hypothetical protein